MTYSYVWHDSFIRVRWCTYMCDTTLSIFDMAHSWHGTFMTHFTYTQNLTLLCVVWIIYMCGITHWCVCLDSDMAHSAHKQNLTHSYVSQSHVWHDSFMYVIWLIRTHDKTRPKSLCSHAAFPGKQLVCAGHMMNSYMWHDSFICVTWLIHMCDMTHSYGW